MDEIKRKPNWFPVAIRQGIGAARENWQWLEGLLKPLLWRIPMSLNGGVISIELQANGVGLFATMTQVLYLLVYCDQHNYTPRIRLTGINYVNPKVGPDWFHYFFEYHPDFAPKEGASPIFTLRVHNMDEIGIGKYLPTFPELGTTLTDANRVFFKYFRIKAEIEAAVADFCQRHFTGSHTLGVHYRGTDKGSEAPNVSWEYALESIIRYLDTNSHVDTIFLASDEAGFINTAKIKLQRVKVVAYDDEYRSQDHQAVHSLNFGGDNYQKGREALINALILSRCSALLRTTSALSGWASVFNPTIPVILLNQPYRQTSWFPETEIVKNARPLP